MSTIRIPQQGSFRGVKFYTQSYTNNGNGRRVDVKEHALANTATVQDLGKKWPEYTLEVFVKQSEDPFAETLITACGKFGAGELVHPTIGRFNAHCTGANHKGRPAESGLYFVSLTFRPASNLGLVVNTNTAIKVIATATSPFIGVTQTQSQAVTKFIKAAAVAEAAKTGAVTQFDTADQVKDWGKLLIEQIEQLRLEDDGELHTQLTALRNSVIEDLSNRAGDLPNLVPFTIPVAMPSLLLSQRLYGNAGRAEELELKTDARSPLALPPVTIEVNRG
ncbi:MAG: DNA circularization N-terminal domain-containing protein [Alphaproteobacteria bacterium]|nr:DNA circularization N-terminal domain-containing protein [Alphaproteobacteria bacterium]